MFWKKLFIVILSLVSLGVSGCFAAQEKSVTVKESSPTTAKSDDKPKTVAVLKPDYSAYGNGAQYLEKYAENSKVKTIILVQQSKTQLSHAELIFLTKDNTGLWKNDFSIKAHLGKNGLGKQVEGDKKTPIGDFGFITAFGILDNPGTVLPYLKVTDKIYCCGDREYYNQIIDISKVNHICTNASEHLIDYSPQYNYALFIDYNKEGKYGKGSAIFLHCNGSYDYTFGCVAVSESDMIKLLKEVDVNTRICIY